MDTVIPNKKLWQEAYSAVAEGDKDITLMAKRLCVNVQNKRGRINANFGMGSALELIANLGVWMVKTGWTPDE